MVDLDVRALGASFYAGNCHKWLCSPKGAGFLWARDDWRDRVRPLVTSHGATSPTTDRSRFHLEFDWTGTADPSPWLAVPSAITTVAGMVDGGWPEVRARNRRLALDSRSVLCGALDCDTPCPDEMVGSLASVALPEQRRDADSGPHEVEPLQDRLFHEHRIEVPVTRWSNPARRAIRVSAQIYNSIDQMRYLASALSTAEP